MATKEEMIQVQLVNRGIRNERVLQAMREIDRSLFVPEKIRVHSYEDRPLPIGKGQTISQPYIVAFMAQELDPQPEDEILEIGTGCGYNASVLSMLVKKVYSIEVVEWLAELAKENIAQTGIENITTKFADGYKGWEEKAPFDAIILTAAPPTIPEPLKQQLTTGGKLLAPVGTLRQQLKLLIRKAENEFEERSLLPVSFVPMTGKAQNKV